MMGREARHIRDLAVAVTQAQVGPSIPAPAERPTTAQGALATEVRVALLMMGREARHIPALAVHATRALVGPAIPVLEVAGDVLACAAKERT